MTELPTGPQPWKPEIVVDRDLARSLIDEQFPELAPARVVDFGVGWDNTAYLVNDVWVFRFPRRTIAVPWMAQEAVVLPKIHDRVPLPIPRPEKIGQPSERYAWPFAGYRMLPGEPACHAHLSHDERLQLAAPLGRFIAALHAIRAEEAESLGAGPDTIKRMDLEYRVPRAREIVQKAVEQGLIADPAPQHDVIERVQATRTPEERCLVHGDLYSLHLLIGEDRALAGVIDWGDLHVGEPGNDLMIAFTLLPPEARTAFREAYGSIDDDTWLRAQFRAVHHSAHVACYAQETEKPDLLREAQLALAYVC